jgi:hypothetical protein
MPNQTEREFLKLSAIKKKEYYTHTEYIVWLLQYLYDSESLASEHGCGRNNEDVLRAAFAEILNTVYEADSTIRRLHDVIGNLSESIARGKHK